MSRLNGPLLCVAGFVLAASIAVLVTAPSAQASSTRTAGHVVAHESAREGLLAYRLLHAPQGGIVRARDGAQLDVPYGALEGNALATITSLGGGRYDFNIAGPWTGRVRVTLPPVRGATFVMHELGGNWVQEGSRGARTVWVGHLSLFSWLGSLGDKIKNSLCLTRDPLQFVQCLAEKGLQRVDSALVRWIAGLAGVSNQCAQALIASGGFVGALLAILPSGECTAQVGETGPIPPPPTASSPTPPKSAPTTPPISPTPTQVPTPSPPTPAPPTFAETPGPLGVATFTDYHDAGGSEGPRIPEYETVQVTCRVEGFEPADHGIPDNWWYEIASSPWNNAYYAYAEPFYNDGQTSGSLIGTPPVDTSVPIC
jgi:hypothetical protein